MGYYKTLKMKKTILLAFGLALVSGIVQAQEENQNQNDPIEERRAGRLMRIVDMDQRKIYHWANGQKATPSGRQAGDPDAVYARVIGDSAVVVKREEEEEEN